MSKKYVALSLLLVFILTAGLTYGQSPGNNSSNVTESITPIEPGAGNESMPGTNASSPAAADGNASETAKAAAEIAKMSGIWSISGIEIDPITAALKQEGSEIYGQSKYEPDAAEPWNGIAIGSVDGNNLDMVIVGLVAGEQVSMWLNGTYSNEAFSGKFFLVSKGAISSRGEFSAILVNPEIADYTPAKVTEPAAQPAPTTETKANIAGTTAPAVISENTVEISSSFFQPNPITIPAGTTVTWINRDAKDHTVTSVNNAFDSGNIASGAGFKYAFSQPGTYDYYCRINPSMTGKVIVTGKSRYTDVREYEDKIGPGGDLSGIPPGMG